MGNNLHRPAGPASPGPEPPAPPRLGRRRPAAARWAAAVAGAVAVVTAGVLVAVAADRPAAGPGAAAAGPGPVAASTGAAARPVGAGSTGSGSTTAPVAAGQPLWPFADAAQATGWQRAYRQSGSQPWHLDAGATALGFAQHLGYPGIDRAIRSTVDGRGAYVAVGFRLPDGSLHTAADVHLVRLSSGTDPPWEVVGTRDTTLTLTRPAYGSTVTSPLPVGGRITGVDERVLVTLHTAAGRLPSASPAAVQAGGQRAPWSVRVDFRAEPGTLLTVAAATGGHVAAVERFAVTGVRVGAAVGRPRPAVPGDVDGDGRPDTVSVTASGTVQVRYATGSTDTVSVDTIGPEGRLRGLADADADGRSEVFVHVGAGAYTEQISVLRYVDGRLRPVTLDGRQVELVSGASLRHSSAWACRPPAAPILQWFGDSDDGPTYRGTLVSYRFSGAALVRVASRPLTADAGSPAPRGCGELRT